MTNSAFLSIDQDFACNILYLFMVVYGRLYNYIVELSEQQFNNLRKADYVSESSSLRL